MADRQIILSPKEALAAVLNQDYLRPTPAEFIRHIRAAFAQDPEWFRENDMGDYGMLIPLSAYEFRLRLITSLRLMGFTQQELIAAVKDLVKASRWEADNAEGLQRRHMYRMTVVGSEADRMPGRH